MTTRRYFGNYHSLLICLSVACVIAPFTLGAQDTDTSRTVPALIVEADAFKYANTDAVLIRRHSAQVHDVLVFRKGHADAASIDYAVGLLRAVRKRFGSTPMRDELIRVSPPPGPISEARRLRVSYQDAERWEVTLRGVKKVELENFGRVGYATIWLKE